MGNICQIPCAGDLLNRGLDFALEKLAYISGLEKFFEELEGELAKLIEAKNDVQREVDKAERQQGMKRRETVGGWLSRVEALKHVVDELGKQRSQETQKLCLCGYCSKSCISSYKFGRKVADTLHEVQKLNKERPSGQVAEEVPEDAVKRPIEGTIVGQQAILDEIWGCLHGKEQVGIIGIYGMGGIGKTTLLTQIYNKFLGDQSKKGVIKIWAKVTKDLKPEKIQEEIWKMLSGLNDSWKAKSLEGKRSDIFKNLSKKKFVLLLDDIWERVDIIDIGVPIPNEENESKIIFTTRSIDVCRQMEARRKFKVNCLQEMEAWKLFEEKVGDDTLRSGPEIPKLAGEMAKECCGLPLALITVGRAMADKKLQDWKNSLDLLRKSASYFQGMEDKVFRILKLSYDHLPTDTHRSCLLYCSLFPKHHRIDVDDLIDSWIGEGFFDEDNGRVLASDTISGLVDACLLEQEEDKEGSCVKLHGVIRDMALWMGRKVENYFVQADYGLSTPPENIKWEQVRRISLMKNYIERLSNSPNCPDLRTLFLNINRLGEISDDFFQFMASLRVLNLSSNRLLYKCPAGVAKLVSLQRLDLSHTSIRTLPEELKALVNLKCLNLDHTEVLAEAPQGLISNFSRLEVLRMFACGVSTELWRAVESLVKELLGLKYLNVLTMTLKNLADFEACLALLHNLEGCTQSLLLHRFNGLSIDVKALAYLKRLNKLRISWCTYLEEFRIDYAAGAVQKAEEPLRFSSLEAVQIDRCRRLKDLTWLVFAPNLKNISVSDCIELEEIIGGEKLDTVLEMIPNLKNISKAEEPLRFSSLEAVQIDRCRRLKDLTWLVFAPNLKNISVSDCMDLEEIIGGEKLDTVLEMIPNLKNISKAEEPLRFSSLEAVQIDRCRRLKDLTWLFFAPNLKNISVSDCIDLEEIISAEKLDTVLEMIPNQSPFQQLQHVDFKGLANLSIIYWEALPFPYLKEIAVSNCPGLKKLPLDSSSAKGCNIVIKGEKGWWENLEWEDQATKDVFRPCFQTEKNIKNLAAEF